MPPPKLETLKFNPGLNAEKPGMVIFGVKESFAIIATVLACTSNFTMLYSTSSLPDTVTGVAPVVKPSLNCGPIKIHPDPVYKYNC